MQQKINWKISASPSNTSRQLPKQAFSKLLSTRDPNPGKKGDKSEKRKEGVLSLGDILKQVQKGRVESRVCHWSIPISGYICRPDFKSINI